MFNDNPNLMRSLLLSSALAFISITCFCQGNPNNAFINSRGCVVCDQYSAGSTFTLNGITYSAVDRPLLETMRDNGSDLSKVCVSLVTNMSELFRNKQQFNQDIGNWDVGNVTDMSLMFYGASAFDQD
jgi:surface protein